MSDNIPDEIVFVCDRVRFAKLFGEEFDEQMKKHLSECVECRTFFEQNALMEKELGALGVDTFTKNGMTVADSVMEEVKRQEMFTKGKPAKVSNGVFRHFGLVAACIVLAVMVLPVMDNVFGTKKQDAEFAREMAADDAGVAPADAYRAGESGSFESYSYALNGIAEAESEEMFLDEAGCADDNIENSNMYSAGSAGEALMFKTMPKPDADCADNEAYQAEMFLFDAYENGESFVSGELEKTAFMGALSYLGNGTKPIRDSVAITFAGDNLAYAVFETDNGDKITVCLEKLENLWVVNHVCDGDITE